MKKSYQEMTDLEKFKELMFTFGFIIPKGAEFYRLKNHEEHGGKIGMKVGEYTHSCHVDTTDIFVLMLIDEKTHKDFVVSECDLWLTKL